jgi:hypothetical protein
MEAENNEASRIVYPVNLLASKVFDFGHKKGYQKM